MTSVRKKKNGKGRGRVGWGVVGKGLIESFDGSGVAGAVLKSPKSAVMYWWRGSKKKYGREMTCLGFKACFYY